MGHGFVLHIGPDAMAWTSDALPVAAGTVETRAFFLRYGVTHAIVFEGHHQGRQRQLAYVGARPIASVVTRPVLSRTRRTVGPTERMKVYELPRAR